MILHPSSGWLSAAHPFLPAARMAAAPAGRRYLAGWATRTELHTLNDSALERRAGGARFAAGPARHRPSGSTPNWSSPPTTRGSRRPWGPRSFAPLPALGVADRGGRPVLRGAVLELPAGGPPAPQRGRARRRFPPSARDAIILGGSDLRPARPRGRPPCLRPARRPAAEERARDRARDGFRRRRARDRAGLARSRPRCSPPAPRPARSRRLGAITPGSSSGRSSAQTMPIRAPATQQDRRASPPRAGTRPRRGSSGSRSTAAGGSKASSSRAASTPEAGTSTSRGPAARKSGTSKPPERRRMLGIPSSSRMPWISSASARLRPDRDPVRLAAGEARLDLAGPLGPLVDRLDLGPAGRAEQHPARRRRTARPSAAGPRRIHGRRGGASDDVEILLLDLAVADPEGRGRPGRRSPRASRSARAGRASAPRG